MLEPLEIPPDRESLGADTKPNTGQSTYGEMEPDELHRKLFAMAKAAVNHAASSDLSKRKSAMARSYRAYSNEHSEGSKYKHKNYSSRSKLHLPKTRAAVKGKMVAAHAALFGTDDVVAITASDDSNPEQLASAEINKALLNYRLDRTSHKAGIPWFRISMGACMDAVVAGVCVSKTWWEYKEVLKEAEEDFDPTDKNLDPTVVGMNGRPMRRKVLRDRPMIDGDIAPENVVVDMTSPWYDVVQDGAFFIVKMAMKVGDVRAKMKPGAQHLGGGPWFNIADKVLASAVNDISGTSVRTSRNQGTDRYSRSSTPSVNDFDIVWVHENFIRYNDCDYHFWTLGAKQLLSEPGEVGTKGHYPAHHGERPYVMGVGAIEPHNALPMSHVEAWRPLQDQGNDLTNLYLDALKQNIAPIAMYRRGANVDLRAVRERGPDATIQVSDLEKDVKFDRAGGADPAALNMMDRLNSQFDELAGSFAQSTVQSSRALNETVGGMAMFSNAAASVQEFDNQVFLQTWAEPVLRHIVWLEQYYETDETLLALMAKKADVYQRFGINQQIDQLLEREITVKVNIGPGAGDPNQKMQRINAALDMSMKAGPLIQGQAQMMAEPFLKEVWSVTGVSADRIIKFKSLEEAEQNQPPNPDEMKMQIEQEKIALERELKQLDVQIAQEKNALERDKLELEREKIAAELERANEELGLKQQEAERATAGQAHEMDLAERDYGIREQSGKESHALAVAGHNQKMLEAAPLAEGVKDPASAMQEAVGQFQQIMVMIAQSQQSLAESQQQTTQQIAILAQGQAETSALLREVVTYQRAPKQAVKTAEGRWTLKIDGEQQPVEGM